MASPNQSTNQPSIKLSPKWTAEKREEFKSKINTAIAQYHLEITSGNPDENRVKFINLEIQKLGKRLDLIREDENLESQIQAANVKAEQSKLEALERANQKKAEAEVLRSEKISNSIQSISRGVRSGLKKLPLLGVLGVMTYSVSDVVGGYRLNERIDESIEQTFSKSEEIQSQLAACIENNKQNDVQSASVIFHEGGFGFYNTQFFSPNLLAYRNNHNQDQKQDFEVFPCETSAGTVYLSMELQKDQFSCRTRGKNMFLALPIAEINDNKISCTYKIDEEKRINCTPTLYATTSWVLDARLQRTGFALRQDRDDSTQLFYELALAPKVFDKAAEKGRDWEDFMKKTLQNASVNKDNDLIKLELSQYGKDAEKLFKDYIKDFKIIKGPKATDKQIKDVEAMKPKLVKRLVKFHQYLEKNTPPEKRLNILKNFYRHFKCNPIVTTIDNTIVDAAGLHHPNTRNVTLKVDVYLGDNPEFVVDVWFHEIMHDLTTDNDPGNIIAYDTGYKRLFIEGIAELSTGIINPPMINQGRAGWMRMEYLDFTLLAGAYLSKEGVIECFSEEDGLFLNMYGKRDQRIENLMKRWNIDPKYKGDLEKVYGNGDPTLNLQHIKLPTLNIRIGDYAAKNTAKRLVVLKEILKLNKIDWMDFKKQISKRF